MFNKFCRWLESNRGPLVSEATALPTEPHNHCPYSEVDLFKGIKRKGLHQNHEAFCWLDTSDPENRTVQKMSIAFWLQKHRVIRQIWSNLCKCWLQNIKFTFATRKLIFPFSSTGFKKLKKCYLDIWTYFKILLSTWVKKPQMWFEYFLKVSWNFDTVLLQAAEFSGQCTYGRWSVLTIGQFAFPSQYHKV